MKIDFANLKFDEKGLIPAIVQDVKTNAVLMLAYMNEESLARTVETGYTWFWSRSRQELWNKGATSGHMQKVLSITYDCDGDALLVPKQSQEVTVIGEVQNATSHLYRPGLSRDDYISLSGNMTRKADDGRIYVVRADGSVVSGQNSKWFSRGSQVAMRPGDTVVVPLDTERLPTLPLWQAITQIIYNLAIGAAAVNSF